MSDALSTPERPADDAPMSEASKKIGVFGARGRAKELAAEVDRLLQTTGYATSAKYGDRLAAAGTRPGMTA